MHTAAGRAPAAAPQLPAASASSSLGGSSGPSAARAGGSAAGRPTQKFPAARLRPRAILKSGRVVGPRRAAERVDGDARIGRGPPWLPGGGGSGRVRVLRAAIDPGPARARKPGPPACPCRARLKGASTLITWAPARRSCDHRASKSANLKRNSCRDAWHDPRGGRPSQVRLSRGPCGMPFLHHVHLDIRMAAPTATTQLGMPARRAAQHRQRVASPAKRSTPRVRSHMLCALRRSARRSPCCLPAKRSISRRLQRSGRHNLQRRVRPSPRIARAARRRGRCLQGAGAPAPAGRHTP